MRRSINIFYLVTVLANLDRAFSMLVMAWITLEITNRLAAVGQIFVISHILYIVLGPGIGSAVDRLQRRHCIIAGQSIIALASAIPLAMWMTDVPLTFSALALVAGITALGNLFNIGALDGLLQQLVPLQERRKVSAVVGGLRQAAMVAGVGVGGLALEAVGGTGAFLIMTVTSLLVAGAVYLLPKHAGTAKRPAGYAAYARDVKEGFKYSLAAPGVAVLGLTTALAFSAGQLGNALLPAFVRDEIGGGSVLFGIVDAAWSVGGITAAFAVNFFLQRHEGRYSEYVLLSALGASMVALAFAYQPLTVIVLHLSMGAAFSACKVLCDGLLLQRCREDFMGRVRINIQMLTSALGIAMYISPTLLQSGGSRELYFGWGCLLAVAGCVIWIWSRKPLRAKVK